MKKVHNEDGSTTLYANEAERAAGRAAVVTVPGRKSFAPPPPTPSTTPSTPIVIEIQIPVCRYCGR